MIRLSNQNARLISVNVRAEVHGETREPACDLKFEVMLPNAVLNQLHPALLGMLYFLDESKKHDLADQASDGPMDLRIESLGMPLKWEGEQIGGSLTIHWGIESVSAIDLAAVKVNALTINAHDHGIVELSFRVQCHPDEQQFGKLCNMVQQDVSITLTPPEAQPDIPGTDAGQ